MEAPARQKRLKTIKKLADRYPRGLERAAQFPDPSRYATQAEYDWARYEMERDIRNPIETLDGLDVTWFEAKPLIPL